MGLGTINKTISLLTRLIDDKTTTEPILEFSPQKPSLPKAPVSSPLPRTSPESVGISSAYIAEFLTALELDKSLNMHTVTILRHGKVICEAGFGAYNTQYFSSTFSECKSITSLAIGILIGDGKLRLDEKVIDMFPDDDSAMAKIKYKNLTVEDLLTMRSGATFAEAGSMADSSWIKAFFSSSVKGDIGETFNYNSLNTYMLSAIVKQKSGKNLLDFLRERLFDEMDIQGIFWEKSPEGIEKGGWGLSLTAEDAAKLGQLCMNMGRWNGKQIVSEEWIRQATSVQINTPNGEMKHGYGYQIWMSDDEGDYQFNGAFGQYVLVFPKYETVIAMYSGSSNLFVNGGLSGMVHELLSSFADEPLAADNETYASLKSTLNSLEYSPSHPRYLGTDAEEFERIAYRLDGREYFAGPNTGGLFPQTLQAVHSNMTDSVTMLRFEKRDKDLYLYIYEKDERNLLVLRHDGAFEYGAATMRGERQLVATRCRWKLDVNRIRLWVMTGFIETPNSRILTLDIAPQKMSVTFDERPALDKTVQMLFDLVGVSSMAFYRHMLPLLQRENLVNLVKRFTEPVAECVMVKHNDEEPLPRIEK